MATKPAFGSKSNFVRNLPADTPAKDVVAAAAKTGLKLSIGQVYNIRSTTKAKTTEPKKAKTERALTNVVMNDKSDQVDHLTAQLRTLIADVGLTRAHAIMAEVEAVFKAA